MERFLFILLIASSLAMGGVPAQAHQNRDNARSTYLWMRWGNLDEPVNHLNRMVGHVRWQLTRYHPDSSVRRDFAQIRREVDQVNVRFRSGHYDRRQMKTGIDRLHDRLHQLEERLHVRATDYYPWR